MSETFVKTLRNAPKDETAKSARFLTRAGYIHKELAGVYVYLPLGLRVIEKIEAIIREELNAIGGQELVMSALQNPEPWIKTGRWSEREMDIWFKTALAAGGELGLAPTHEEPLTKLMRDYIESYKDLPCYVYQFQTKFRNELRAKSGILRTREFIMKDLYSFSPDAESHAKFYARVEEAYRKIYQRLGIGEDTFETFASGGAFAKYSHEFQTLLPVGEDTVCFNADKSVVLNKEVLKPEVLADLGVKESELTMAPAAEVGNIFTLGLKFSEPLGLTYATREGEQKPVFMGSYGIGVSRLVGVITEKFADDKGLIWPAAIAPYQAFLIGVGEAGQAAAEKLYQKYPEAILFDDRDLRPGEKFTDADLIGLPKRVVISEKTLAKKQAEVQDRQSGVVELVDLGELERAFDKKAF